MKENILAIYINKTPVLIHFFMKRAEKPSLHRVTEHTALLDQRIRRGAVRRVFLQATQHHFNQLLGKRGKLGIGSHETWKVGLFSF